MKSRDQAQNGSKLREPALPDRDELRRLKQFIPYIRPYRLHILLAAGLVFLGSVAGLLMPWVSRSLVDTVFVGGNLSQLNVLGLTMVALYVVQSGLGLSQSYVESYVNRRIVLALRVAVEERLLTLPLGFFSDRRVGELVSRLTSDVSYIDSVFVGTPLTILRLSVSLVGGLWLMWKMNHELTFLVFLVIPPLVLMVLLYSRRMRRFALANQDILAEAVADLQEALAGIRVVKAFAREDYESDRFEERLEQGFQVEMKQQRMQAVFGPLAGLLGFLPAGLVLWFGAVLVSKSQATFGDLVAFMSYSQMVVGLFVQVGYLYSTVRQSLTASQRVIEIMEMPPEPQSAPGLPVLPPLTGRMTFNNVSFAYNPGQLVLENIDLEVLASQVVAIVGCSGVGKTTLVNLVPRFFDPTNGSIKVDGHDLRQVDLRSLRQQIGLVPQETFLFAGSVRANIAYGRPKASETEIIAAAHAVFADDFIREMAQGYDTVVGERGVKLSAGQRQRIAIARALLKNPRILILDEATSALDTESERYVQAALDRLMQGRTTFVIAHRLSTIERADRILVLQDGRIVEDGAHAHLLAQGGTYYRLWQMQFAEADTYTQPIQG